MLKFSNLQEYLSLKLNKKITQADLCKALNLDKSSVSLRIKNDSFLKESHIKKIEEYYEIKLDNEALSFNGDNKNFFEAKFYTDVIGSCGLGVFEQSQTYEKLKLPKHILNNYNSLKEYSVITAKGNSMAGSIEDGDKLLIESYENEQIVDNQIYIFCYKQEFFIKRLYKNVNQIIIKSDNNDFPTRYIENEDINNIKIIGKVVALVRNYY